MKWVVIAVAMVGAAIVLILTKPTPEEIVQAASGKINYVVLNKDDMPRDFLPAVAAAAIIQGIGQLFSDVKRPDPNAPLRWRTDDLIILRYSNLTLSGIGALKCVWLLRSGFCHYSKP